MSGVDVQINGPDMCIVADRAMKAALFAVGEQALKDCNRYCKQDFGGLIFSSAIHTVLESNYRLSNDTPEKEREWAMSSPGSSLEANEKNEVVLVWAMPYAAYQYKLPSAYPDKNTLAQSEWCKAAENNHRQQWDITFRNTLRSNGL